MAVPCSDQRASCCNFKVMQTASGKSTAGILQLVTKWNTQFWPLLPWVNSELKWPVISWKINSLKRVMPSWNRTRRRVVQRWGSRSLEETTGVVTSGLLANERENIPRDCLHQPGSSSVARSRRFRVRPSSDSVESSSSNDWTWRKAAAARRMLEMRKKAAGVQGCLGYCSAMGCPLSRHFSNEDKTISQSSLSLVWNLHPAETHGASTFTNSTFALNTGLHRPWMRSLGLRLGPENPNGQLTFLLPKGDGHAAPVLPEKPGMSQTPGKPTCSCRRLCKGKCQLLFPGLAQPREHLGPVTVPLSCRVTVLCPHRFLWANNLRPTFMGMINPWGLVPLWVVLVTFCVGAVAMKCWERCYSCDQRGILAFFLSEVPGLIPVAAEGQNVTFSKSSELLWWNMLFESEAALLSSARLRSRCTNLHPKNVCM